MNDHTQNTLSQHSPVRICFGLRAQDIPGEPCARPLTLANAFMELHYGRKFDWDMDHVYTPAGIDEVGEGSKRRLYMFLDVNKQLRPSPIPLRCVKVVNKDIL